MKKDITTEILIRDPAEFYALERRAREERARVLAAGIRRAAAAVKSLYARTVAALTAKVVRHA